MSRKKLDGNSVPGQLSFAHDWPAIDIAGTPQQQSSRRKAARKMRQFTVRELREHLQLTSTEIATHMGTQRPAIVRCEQGGVSPTTDWLIKMVAALGGQLRFVVDLPDGQTVEMKLPERRKPDQSVVIPPARPSKASRGRRPAQVVAAAAL